SLWNETAVERKAASGHIPFMTDVSPERIAMDDAACLALLREQDRDAYFALLFAPVDYRPALAALHAYVAELASIRVRVSEPLPGEVRIQWWRDVLGWRDVLTGEEAHGGAGHPVAAALLRAIQRYRLPASALDAMADAMITELYDDAWPTITDLEGQIGAVDSGLMRLSALVLADGDDAGPADAPGHAGLGLGITRLLRQFPQRAARGQAVMPMDVMAKHGVTREAIIAGQAETGLMPALAEMRGLARAHIAKAKGFIAASPVSIRPAFRQMALCEGYLRQMEASDYDPFRTRIERTPLGALWTLWRGLG
ncbi:MAG: phytoene/squalene synthase family protein, partial [Bosea sp. (in: a-proteobacteria)]